MNLVLTPAQRVRVAELRRRIKVARRNPERLSKEELLALQKDQDSLRFLVGSLKR